jgi:hypothetical protein
MSCRPVWSRVLKSGFVRAAPRMILGCAPDRRPAADGSPSLHDLPTRPASHPSDPRRGPLCQPPRSGTGAGRKPAACAPVALLSSHPGRLPRQTHCVLNSCRRFCERTITPTPTFGRTSMLDYMPITHTPIPPWRPRILPSHWRKLGLWKRCSAAARDAGHVPHHQPQRQTCACLFPQRLRP